MADEPKAAKGQAQAQPPATVTLAEWATANLHGRLYMAKVLCISHRLTMADQKTPDEWAQLLQSTLDRRVG